MTKSMTSLALSAAFALTAVGAAQAAGEKVSVLTPYLSAIATAEMIDSFKAQAEKHQWAIDVVDTAGDMGAFASRLEDATTKGANAIVLVSVDPAQIQDQVDKAKAAGIPVITIDGAKNASTVLNVTSDNFVLGQTMTKFLFDTIDAGRIVYGSDYPFEMLDPAGPSRIENLAGLSAAQRSAALFDTAAAALGLAYAEAAT